MLGNVSENGGEPPPPQDEIMKILNSSFENNNLFIYLNYSLFKKKY